MEKAILLAIAASFCTATASVCQRLGARRHEMTGFDGGLVFRLARQPGMASMILGFVFQIAPCVSGRWPWSSRSWLKNFFSPSAT